ncbi:MAG: glutathione S-transferase [Pseudomonas sp.]|uniref:glutathione S-transferase n=1 Tax=Pseudomonas abieticivorans TaxID=2931382 RepID=UPI0020BF2B6B|nr:glutathione S-transferase [Pseudomonas sp. PIA16]MDE1169383.1 glutathione S-transferase [Pseudomonas sp.]
MKLYGMLDSPYVRRVALSLDLYGITFEHFPLSVFSTFDAFAQVNPVVKAPTLVLDDGTVLMDSALILDYFETLSAPAGKRRPQDARALGQALRTEGLALAACEKSIQLVYEHNLRPEEKRHQPWVARVTGQLLAACAALEQQIAALPPADDQVPGQAEVTSAVAWSFMLLMVPDVIKPADFPALHAHAARLEATALFKRYPMV